MDNAQSVSAVARDDGYVEIRQEPCPANKQGGMVRLPVDLMRYLLALGVVKCNEAEEKQG